MTQDEIIFMARASGWMSEYESSTGFSAEAAITFAKLLSQRTWVGLTNEDLANCSTLEAQWARYWEKLLKEKNT